MHVLTAYNAEVGARRFDELNDLFIDGRGRMGAVRGAGVGEEAVVAIAVAVVSHLIHTLLVLVVPIA